MCKKNATNASGSKQQGKEPCAGRHSAVFPPMQDTLLRFIFELHEQRMPVSVSMVALKVAQLIAQKSRIARLSAARRFVLTHGLVHRLGTHKSQRPPSVTAADAMDFMTTVARPEVINQVTRHPDYILNMDQTPIPFMYN